MPKISPESHVSRRLRFRDLQVFIAVFQCGSMGKAALQLGITQPSVSEVISNLESTIGAPLFERTAQGVAPTLYGRALSKRAHAAFDEMKQGLRDLEYIANPTVGEVRIGCPDSIAATILPSMIVDFCREFPGIALRFDHAPSPTMEVPDLHARKLDVVISWLSVPLESHRDDLDVEVLFNDRVVVAAAKQSKWARRRKVSLADLVEAPWTGTPPETMARMLMNDAFRDAGLAPPKNGSVEFFSAVAKSLGDLGRLSDGNAEVAAVAFIRFGGVARCPAVP